jgi:hypothetical protein
VERHDDAPIERELVAEQLQREGPADAEQVNAGFATGIAQRTDAPEENLEPNFARGLSEEPPGGGLEGRFSTGKEVAPANPENNIERRFSEGIEESPTSR